MEKNTPLIIAFVSDLMFSSKISNVTRHLDYRVEWIEQASQLGEETARKEPRRPGERLEGREGALFAQIIESQPALLLFDLTNKAVPWRTWAAALKSSPATRRIPILGFGPHEDVNLLTGAKTAGVNFVYARSRFFSDMPALLKKHARIVDVDKLAEHCKRPLPPLVVEGINLFNQGEFYKCHDALEEAWKQDRSVGRDLYRAILQIGIAYFQIGRGNYRGGLKMLLRVRQWLDPLPPTCRGINIAKLRTDSQAVQEALAELGAENIADFDRSLFKQIEFTT
ncbi:MAG: DUF309 domain-containing protein [Chloroflexota bacterium]